MSSDTDLVLGTPVVSASFSLPTQRKRPRFVPTKPIVPGDGDARHGRSSTYTNYGCRCTGCSEAKREDEQRRRADRIARGLQPGDPRHGRASSYSNYGCHCTECVAANTADTRTRRGYVAREESSVDVELARVRIQDRIKDGESIKQVASMANLSFSTVNNILNGKTKRVLLTTLQAICVALDAPPEEVPASPEQPLADFFF